VQRGSATSSKTTPVRPALLSTANDSLRFATVFSSVHCNVCEGFNDTKSDIMLSLSRRDFEGQETA